jgi:hypothetical protein
MGIAEVFAFGLGRRGLGRRRCFSGFIFGLGRRRCFSGFIFGLGRRRHFSRSPFGTTAEPSYCLSGRIQGSTVVR